MSALPTTTSQRPGASIIFDDDGCPFDPDTGEPIDIDTLNAIRSQEARAEKVGEEAESILPPLVIEDRGDVERALAIKARIEGQLLALGARREAMLKNFDAQIRSEQSRLEWWEWRFGSAVKGFARKRLVGKSRTAKFDMGQVSFRHVRGTPSIINDDAALRWAKDWAPSIIKVKHEEWVTARDIVEKLPEIKEATEDPSLVLPFLVYSEDKENITISTGVEKE
jgi:hypothetical protein